MKVDESSEAIKQGIASDAVVNRLALAPSRIKSNIVWRWLVRFIGTVLVSLVIGLSLLFYVANSQRKDALSGELIAIAENLSKQHPDQSLLLGLAGWRISAIPKADAFIRSARANYTYHSVLRGHEMGSIAHSFLLMARLW